MPAQHTSHKLPQYRVLATAIGIALAALPTQVRAETETPKDDQGKDTVLSKVRVKGQADDPYKAEPVSPKYTAPLVDTPKSVTVIPKEVIQQSGSTTLTDALRTTPGITMGAGEGGNPQGDRPFIRGFDSQGSIFVDGMRDVGAQSREIFDLESVEVSKGSGGAFNGRGAGGGGINLVSKSPKAENFLAGSIGLGTASYQRYTLDGNYQTSDTTAVRLNLMKHESDVAGRDEVNVDRWGVAPSLALGLGTSTRTTISYYHMQSDDMPDPGLPYNNPLSSGPYLSLNGDGGPLNVDRDTFYGLTQRDFRKTNTDITTVAIENDLTDAITLRSTTRYGRAKQDYILTQPDDSKGNFLLPTTGTHVGGTIFRRPNTRVSDTETIANQTDVFGSFQTGAIKHNFSAGIELSREENEIDSYTITPANSAVQNCPPSAVSNFYCTTVNDPNPDDPWNGSAIRAHNPRNITTTTKSIYAFNTAELSAQWLLNLGLRFDKYSTSQLSAITSGVRTKLERDDNLLNWQAGAVYKPANNGSVYLSYSTASIPAGSLVGEGAETNALAADSLKPEKTRTVELGTKWDVLDEKLALTAAVFRTEKYNARVQVDATTYELSGQQRVDGLELGLAGNITSKWQMFGGLSYLKSEIVDAGKYGSNGAQAGNEIPNTPKKSASLWTTYQVLPALTIGGGAFYVDKVWGNTANTKWVPSYVRYDAMATYKINQNLDLQLNIQNLTDKRYYDKAYSTHFVSIAPGRFATMALNFKY